MDEKLGEAPQDPNLIEKIGDVAGGIWSNMSPLEKTAIATAPVPIVGDIAGFAADIDMYKNRPEERTGFNYALSALGVLPFIPSRSQVKAAAQGIEQLAASQGVEKLATSNRPFVTKGSQYLSEKIQGNAPKENLLAQIRSAQIPQTDKSMLLEAVELAETDAKGRINTNSLKDVYETISPENRTFIKVSEPSETAPFLGLDNVTGSRKLGVLEIGVDPNLSTTFLEDDVTDFFNKMPDLFENLQNEFIEAGKDYQDFKGLFAEADFKLNSFFKQNPDLFPIVGEDVTKMMEFNKATLFLTDEWMTLNHLGTYIKRDTGDLNRSFGFDTAFKKEELVNNEILIKELADRNILIPLKGKPVNTVPLGDDRSAVTIYNNNFDSLYPGDDLEEFVSKETGLFVGGYMHVPQNESNLSSMPWGVKIKTIIPEDLRDNLVMEKLENNIKKYAPNLLEKFDELSVKGFDSDNRSEISELLRKTREGAWEVKGQAEKKAEKLQEKIRITLKKEALLPNVYNSTQHRTLNTLKEKASQMTFARYADVDVNVPFTEGSGSLKGMHFSELQSDYADDLRVKGSTKGSKKKDKELLKKLDDELKDLEPGEKRSGVLKKRDKIEARIYDSESGLAIEEELYSVPEIYPDMGERGNVQQTIDIVGAVMAGVKRGKNSVTFPIPDDISALSARGLYEPSKFKNNLREAVKRLGKDFQMGEIEVVTETGVLLRPGITWSNEAEPLIGNKGKGVKMFKSGGIVAAQPNVRGSSGIVDVLRQYRREGVM